MPFEDKKVYIIILSWNNAPVTLDCLRSLEGVGYSNKEILLIDNGSTDGSLRMLEDYRVQSPLREILMILSLQDNLGFAGGNNYGMKLALERGAEYVLLLNNDTVVLPDFLARLVRTAEENKDFGALGGKIYYFPDKEKIWFTGGKINCIKGAFYHKTREISGVIPTDFITGCLMLIPAGVLQKVGLFDERFFLNIEDVDLSKRIKEAGYQLALNTQVVIYHKYSASMGGIYSKRNQYYFHRNRMLFFSKHMRKPAHVLFCFFQMFIAVPLWLCWQFLKGRGDAIKGAIRGYRDYFSGQFGRSERF